MQEQEADRAFSAHIEDLLRAAGRGYRTRFTGFLDMRQAAVARRLAAHTEAGVLFYGGYPDAERVMMGAFSPWETPDETAFPIVAVTARFHAADPVGHRDILGALLGLGLSREAVGDLLVETGRAVLFLTPPAADLALGELQKAGKWGIRLERGAKELPERRFQALTVNVSSLRLDCVTAALTNLSREKAQQMVRGQQVCVDGAVVAESSAQVAPGNVLSLRSYGKFIFDKTLRTTKKDRLVLQCRKYV